VTVGPEFVLPALGDTVWKGTIDALKPVLCQRNGSGRFSRNDQVTGVRDLVAVPMIRDETAIGMIVAVNHRYDSDTFQKDDVELLVQIAMISATEVRNYELIDQLRVEADRHLYDARHDSLTHLPNRVGFSDVVDSVLSRVLATAVAGLEEESQEVLEDEERMPRRAVRRAALMFMDLNQFKRVNDTLGHHVGDVLLVEIARRLASVLPPHWVGARLGGDEFAVIGTFEDDCEIDSFVDNLQSEFGRDIHCDGAVLNTSASIGVAIAPENGTTRATLMRRADVAMYAAKGSANRRFLRYQPEQENVTARQLEMVADLRVALDRKEVDVCYQPRACLLTGEVTGIEALARWNHPLHGPIPPDEFVPLAEQAGLIDQLTDLVMCEAVRVSRDLSTYGLDLEIAVNISARTLRDPLFPVRVFALLEPSATEVPPVRLKFEITEREIVLDSTTTNEVMHRLRHRGVRFSIDDFGTGYSSLAYLTQLPVDEVKIDKTFTSHVCDSSHHRAIVKSVVDIAATIGLSVVAEGVEDQPTWEMLAALGCAEAQGYLLSHPLDVEHLRAWMLNRVSPPVTAG
jgi:diguanylate cyclase (GGDEF)-like protein